MPRIFLTRAVRYPEAYLASLNAQFIHAPLTHIEYFFPSVPTEGITALIATSRHGFYGARLTQAHKALPCYVVGQKTADAAHGLGLMPPTFIAQNSAELSENLPPQHSYLYLRGADISRDLSADRPELNITQSITYAAHAATSLSQGAIHALQDDLPAFIPIASRRSADIFLDLCKTYQANYASLNLMCFSASIKNRFPEMNWQSLRIVNSLDISDLLEACT